MAQYERHPDGTSVPVYRELTYPDRASEADELEAIEAADGASGGEAGASGEGRLALSGSDLLGRQDAAPTAMAQCRACLGAQVAHTCTVRQRSAGSKRHTKATLAVTAAGLPYDAGILRRTKASMAQAVLLPESMPTKQPSQPSALKRSHLIGQ